MRWWKGARQGDDRLGVTIALVNVADERVLWSQRYDVTEEILCGCRDYRDRDTVGACRTVSRGGMDPGLAAPSDRKLPTHAFWYCAANPDGAEHRVRPAQGDRALRTRGASRFYLDPWNGIAQAWLLLTDTYLAPGASSMRAAIDQAPGTGSGLAGPTALKEAVAEHLCPRLPGRRRGLPDGVHAGHATIHQQDCGWLLHARGMDDPAVVGRGGRTIPLLSHHRSRVDHFWRDVAVVGQCECRYPQALKQITPDPCADSC